MLSMRTTVLLGLSQIIVWGGSFFYLAVIAQAVISDTQWPSAWVYGSLSIGIFVSALLAPYASKLIIANKGRLMLLSSAVLLSIGLFVISVAPDLATFIFGWVIIGIAMAFGLQDALFTLLGHQMGLEAKGAITRITLISGFCTTIVWPVVAVLLDKAGWRITCCIYAFFILLTCVPIYLTSIASKNESHASVAESPAKNIVHVSGPIFQVTAIICIASIIMTALSVQLIDLMEGSGLTKTQAILLASLLGPAQVGARLLDMAMGKRSPIITALASIGLTAVGVLLMVLFPGWMAAGIVVYGIGNGLRAIVRASLPLFIWDRQQYATVIGKMTRPALICQALTPVTLGYCLETFGPKSVLCILLALALANVALITWLYLRTRHSVPELATGSRAQSETKADDTAE